MAPQYDVFLSHAGRDTDRYVKPLAQALEAKGITYWLDDVEINWGDSITAKINEGLASSRFLLLCMSQAFLRRPWPEAEMSAAFAIQNAQGVKRVLPLILNNKKAVLARYPLVAGVAYREYVAGPASIASDVLKVLGRATTATDADAIKVAVESVHTGKRFDFTANPRSSVRWLIDRAQDEMGVTELADTGAYVPFRVRWVLVDVQAEKQWRKMARADQRNARALVANAREASGIYVSLDEQDRLADIGVSSGMVFHMYAVEDESRDYSAAAAE